jgi:hypothetical protein
MPAQRSREDEDDDIRVSRRYDAEHPKTNWATIIVQGIAQLIVFGALAVGYVVTNERWKGGVDENLRNLTAINEAQNQINLRLATAIDKLNENVQVLGRNQERVIALLESHMTQEGQATAKQENLRR